MRNNYYANNQTRASSATGDLLLAPADVYDFQRAASLESTETVRAGKLMPATNVNTTMMMQMHMQMQMHMHPGAISPTASFEEEDRGVPVSPKKLPPTPPREHIYHQEQQYPYNNEGQPPSLVPPSAVQQPRLFREASIAPRPLLRPSSWRHEEEETSIFRASPLHDIDTDIDTDIDNTHDGPIALSRGHIGFYSLRRSLAFDDGE